MAKISNPDPRENILYVHDKDGKAIYQTTSDATSAVAEDIKILPEINAEKIYPPKSVFKAENRIALFDTQFNFHADNLALSNFNQIYNDQISSVVAARYEVRTLYVPEVPIHFGLGLNYQSAYWTNSIEQIKLSILSFGPEFEYKFYKTDSFIANALLGAEIAPIYQGTSATYTDKYSATLYDLGIETLWSTSVGLVSVGGHFRHHEIALTQSNRPNLLLTPKEFSTNSLGIMIGYKVEWSL